MIIEKRDILKDFSLSYSPRIKKFHGWAIVNVGEMEIHIKTPMHNTIDGALDDLKEKLVDVYVKADKLIDEPSV